MNHRSGGGGGGGGSSEIIIVSVELIRYFREMRWWLKIPIVQQTALAPVTNLAEELALAH